VRATFKRDGASSTANPARAAAFDSTAIRETVMGRVGLCTVLHWSVFLCAALATASIPAALAQTHPPKIASPAANSALNSEDAAPPKISLPEEAPAHVSDSPSDPAPMDVPTRISDLPSAHPAEEPTAHSSELLADVTPADGLPLAGARGVTHPVCLRCPPAQYSYPALIHRIQGNVTLDAIVGTDGWVSNVRILGSLGAGLDEQAMKTVRTWRWDPARDADGKVVMVHQTVVITFHIPK
jgi:TonB family protein